MVLDSTCVFCAIVNGEISADIVYKDGNILAFNDIDPQAPMHILIVPTVHVENSAQLSLISPTTTAQLFTVAAQIAAQRGLTDFRTVFNTGAEAGQSVFHAHLHLLGGRRLAWPPG